jgi:hypothetical protein
MYLWRNIIKNHSMHNTFIYKIDQDINKDIFYDNFKYNFEFNLIEK